MSQHGHAMSFRDLVVYRKSRAVAREVFHLSKGFPREEMYSLTDQARRASRSIGAQIAEAWAKRRYEKHFVSKLSDADAEQMETQHWLDSARDCDYVAAEEHARLIEELSAIGRMLSTMMKRADEFCGADDRMVRESGADYFVELITNDRSLITDH
jgi:four helix bundle protein